MKRLTKISAIVLTVLMMIPMLTVASSASEGGTREFSDVEKNAWYYDSVKYVSENGLMNGTSATTFSPDMTLSRAMVVTILYRMAGEPNVESADGGEMEFADVKPHEWYTDAVKWAHSIGIVNGVGENNFAPDRDVTRAELVTLLFRYVQKLRLMFTQTNREVIFTDGDDIPLYAKDSAYYLCRGGVVTGKDGNIFDPDANATRAEMAALVERLIERTEVQDYSLLEKLGAKISVSVHITGGYASPTVGELWFGIYLRPTGDNIEELHKADIKVEKVTLSQEWGNVNIGLTRVERFDYVGFTYSEMYPPYVSEGDYVIVNFTVEYDGESAQYQLYDRVTEVW